MRTTNSVEQCTCLFVVWAVRYEQLQVTLQESHVQNVIKAFLHLSFEYVLQKSLRLDGVPYLGLFMIYLNDHTWSQNWRIT